MLKGKIIDVVPEIDQGRLRVQGLIQLEQGEELHALLPQRETAALVPKSILIGEENRADDSLLTVIDETLKRSIVGRTVRLWEYRNKRYFSFATWQAVTFAPLTAAETTDVSE